MVFVQVKELTYMHSEGIQAGELKHGPLALVDSEVPIIMVITRDNVFTKCMNALQQVSYPMLLSWTCQLQDVWLGAGRVSLNSSKSEG